MLSFSPLRRCTSCSCCKKKRPRDQEALNGYGTVLKVSKINNLVCTILLSSGVTTHGPRTPVGRTTPIGTPSKEFRARNIDQAPRRQARAAFCTRSTVDIQHSCQMDVLNCFTCGPMFSSNFNHVSIHDSFKSMRASRLSRLSQVLIVS